MNVTCASYTLFLHEPLLAMVDTINTASTTLSAIYEPEPINFSFDAPGWYLLGIIFSILMVFYFIKRLRQYLKNVYRREALKNLALIETECIKQYNPLLLNDVLVLLKLVAAKTFGRKTVAGLYGDKWLQFLAEKGKNTPFPKYAATISAIIYDSGEIKKNELTNIIDLAKKWINSHA